VSRTWSLEPERTLPSGTLEDRVEFQATARVAHTRRADLGTALRLEITREGPVRASVNLIREAY
jgi:hypothetical protein